jgi:hypothetical protein
MPVDSSTVFPYSATIPWPYRITDPSQLDWVDTVEQIEYWLDEHVGICWDTWCWGTWTLDNPSLCSINFSRNSDCVMFLLRWS